VFSNNSWPLPGAGPSEFSNGWNSMMYTNPPGPQEIR